MPTEYDFVVTVAAAMLALYIGLENERKTLLLLQKYVEKEPRSRRWWVKPWVLQRPIHGAFEALLADLEEFDPKTFKNMLRMEPEFFEYLTDRLYPRLVRKGSNFRKPLQPDFMLAAALRLVQYTTASFSFRE